MDSNMLSDAHKRPLKTRSESEQYNKPNFKTLGKISEKEKIEVIETGFQLNQEGKISLKKYYQGTGEYSLFQLPFGFNSTITDSTVPL